MATDNTVILIGNLTDDPELGLDALTSRFLV
jgi:single-stranded DNA-binding protein